ncbi:MAG: hypothetical protein IJC39_05675 [Firmicutes bacterium]|nr:hypothetical protein [Bacillota bacterium]
MGKIKRSKFAAFLDTGGADTPAWSLIGEGVTSLVISYNPQTSEETYIHQDSGTTDVESYKPTASVPMTAVAGDEVFDFVDGLRRNRAVLADARTNICLVYLYEDAISEAYPAEKNVCSIQIDDFGGDGGGSNVINFTINFVGDAETGTFNPTTRTFTAA